jgi:hypothetical protein
MKPGILLLSSIVFILSLFLLFRHYTHAEEKSLEEQTAHAKALLVNGMTTTATFDSTYTAFRNQGTNKNKVINYSYQVNGKYFEGSQIVDDLPVERSFIVTYLPDDPAIHSINPQDVLNSLKKINPEKSSGFLPWTLFAASIATFFFTRKSYLRDIAENAELEQLQSAQQRSKQETTPARDTVKRIYLAGWEVQLNGNQQCENFIATQITTNEMADHLYQGIELIFENNKLSKAYDMEEGNRRPRTLEQDEIGLSLPNFPPNQILQFLENDQGKHQLGGEIPKSFTLPAFSGRVPFQYLGFISNLDSNFAWLPFNFHLTCPVYLNIENVFLDYTDPLRPVILNREEVEATDTSFTDELDQNSEIVFQKVNFDFIQDPDFSMTASAGVPNWIQYPDIPMCPKSGKRMKFLCQLHGGIPAERTNVTPRKESYRHYFERMNFWGDGDLFVFFEPDSKVACYFIQNT